MLLRMFLLTSGCCGDAAMQTLATFRRQAIVDGVADQTMSEAQRA